MHVFSSLCPNTRFSSLQRGSVFVRTSSCRVVTRDYYIGAAGELCPEISAGNSENGVKLHLKRICTEIFLYIVMHDMFYLRVLSCSLFILWLTHRPRMVFSVSNLVCGSINSLAYYWYLFSLILITCVVFQIAIFQSSGASLGRLVGHVNVGWALGVDVRTVPVHI